MIRTAAVACLISLAAGAVATSADAKTIFETATFTGADTGEYIASDSRYFGVAFTLDKTTEITGLSGQFGGFPGGTIFGAIVSLPSKRGAAGRAARVSQRGVSPTGYFRGDRRGNGASPGRTTGGSSSKMMIEYNTTL
jgi:hypothetical protein